MAIAICDCASRIQVLPKKNMKKTCRIADKVHNEWCSFYDYGFRENRTMGTAQRRQREARQRRESILDAARKVFWRAGYDGATMPQIAAEAELAPGTLYLYFPGKDSLYIELLAEGYDLLRDRLAACSLGDSRPGDRPAAMVDAFFEFARDFPEYFDIMFFVLHREGAGGWDRFPPEQTSRLEALETACRLIVADVLKQAGFGDADGHGPSINAFWSMLAGVVFYFRKHECFDEVAQQAKKLLLAAVAAKGENLEENETKP